MCKFCVEHGEGERWYLQAQNYAFDLRSDLDRREYIIEFISGFPEMRASALTWGNRLDRMPKFLGDAGRGLISRHMQPRHFGQPLPLEDCEQVFALATSITRIPCICRMNTPGKDAEPVCLLVTTQPVVSVLEEGFADYAAGPDLDDFDEITSEEAMALLRVCEERGLMHSIWTFRTPFTAAICNCDLESGCLAMRMTAGHGINLMWRGEMVARLSNEACRSCGACVSACPFGAISRTGRTVAIDTMQCWGCGVCRAHCSFDAITLAERASIPEVADVW